MGTWRKGILADDDAQEVYDEYQRLFDEGQDPAAIRKKLERSWRPGTDDDDAPVFWLALAQCQWDHGVLDEDVLAQVKEIEQRDLGLERWREQGPRAAAARQKVVRAFLKKIQSPRKKPTRSAASRPKPAKKASKKRSIYQPGDCLAVRLRDGTFGAVLVLRSKALSRPADYVGFLNYRGADPPALSVFDERRWLGRHGPKIMFCLASTHREDREFFEVVGTTLLRDDDPRHEGAGPYSVGSWGGIRYDLAEQHGIPQ